MSNVQTLFDSCVSASAPISRVPSMSADSNKGTKSKPGRGTKRKAEDASDDEEDYSPEADDAPSSGKKNGKFKWGAKSQEEEADLKKARRRKQNRDAAQMSRMRKKMKIGHLEDQVKQLLREKERLQATLAKLEAENRKLKSGTPSVAMELEAASPSSVNTHNASSGSSSGSDSEDASFDMESSSRQRSPPRRRTLRERKPVVRMAAQQQQQMGTTSSSSSSVESKTMSNTANNAASAASPTKSGSKGKGKGKGSPSSTSTSGRGKQQAAVSQSKKRSQSTSPLVQSKSQVQQMEEEKKQNQEMKDDDVAAVVNIAAIAKDTLNNKSESSVGVVVQGNSAIGSYPQQPQSQLQSQSASTILQHLIQAQQQQQACQGTQSSTLHTVRPQPGFPLSGQHNKPSFSGSGVQGFNDQQQPLFKQLLHGQQQLPCFPGLSGLISTTQQTAVATQQAVQHSHAISFGAGQGAAAIFSPAALLNGAHRMEPTEIVTVFETDNNPRINSSLPISTSVSNTGSFPSFGGAAFPGYEFTLTVEDAIGSPSSPEQDWASGVLSDGDETVASHESRIEPSGAAAIFKQQEGQISGQAPSQGVNNPGQFFMGGGVAPAFAATQPVEPQVAASASESSFGGFMVEQSPLVYV